MTGILDVLVWANDRVIRWVESIGLHTYSPNLLESGVHGSVIALDETFEADSLIMALQIPSSDGRSRQQLESAFRNLIASATDRRLEGNHTGAGQQVANYNTNDKNTNSMPKSPPPLAPPPLPSAFSMV